MTAEMATLTVRNLDEALVRRLRIPAAAHRGCAEAERRERLRLPWLLNTTGGQYGRRRHSD